MGISIISSYRGGKNFEIIGLSRSMVESFFPGMSSRISGIGLDGLEKEFDVNMNWPFNQIMWFWILVVSLDLEQIMNCTLMREFLYTCCKKL